MAGFTRNPVPPPAAGAPPPPSLPTNQPLVPGRVNLTEYTRRNLESLGWKDGDPIPGDLGERLKQIQQEVEQELAAGKLDLPPDFKPKMGKLVEIASLPPERQAELRGYLAEYKREVDAEQAWQTQEQNLMRGVPADAPPSVREAAQVAARASMEADAMRARAAVSVIDDRVPAGAAQPAPQVAAPATQVPVPAAQVAAAEPLPPTGLTGMLPQLVHCPRCLWDLSLPFEITPTTRDKESFMAAMLGLQRFQKAIEMLGGRMAVTFRGLTSQEVQIINRQLTQQMRIGDIKGEGEYFAWLMEYRLICATQQIEAMGNNIVDVPTLETWTAQHAPDLVGSQTVTALPAMREWYSTAVAPHESLRRVIGQHHRQFQRLVEALEAWTAEENFWIGIELPA